MESHHRVIAGATAGRRSGPLGAAVRWASCLALAGLLAACVVQSPAVPEPEPAPEPPTENEDGWNAVTG